MDNLQFLHPPSRTATGAASSVVEVAPAKADESDISTQPGGWPPKRARHLWCLTPDNMTTRPAGALFEALNEYAPWSISLNYCKILIFSKTSRTPLGLWRSVPSSISTGTPQPCLEEIIVKIAHHAYPHRGGKTQCRQDGATDAPAEVWLGRECRMPVALRSGPVRLHAILSPIFLRMES
jgi:hypothetical protein